MAGKRPAMTKGEDLARPPGPSGTAAPHFAASAPFRWIVATTPGPQRLRRASPAGAQRRAWHRRRRQAEVQRLQPLDLVAEPRSLLELQVRGGDAHLLFQVGNRRLQVLADEFRRLDTLD